MVFSINLNAQKAKDSYSSSSVLASGKWFKVSIISDGIYRIDYSKLKELGLTDPSNPKIFGNNSGQLSYYNDDPKPDDLREISIFTSTGSDGIFNDGDFLLFYGKGTGRWNYNSQNKKFSYLRHNYSDTAHYFITSGSGSGKRVKTEVEPDQIAGYYSTASDALFIHEMESENLIKSGREWFQQISSLSINPGFSDILVSENIEYNLQVASRASVPTIFRLYEGSTVRKSVQVQGINLFNTTGTYAQIVDSSGSFKPLSGTPVYEIKFFNNGELSAKGWLDYITLHARKTSIFTGSSAQFTDSKSIAPGMITQFSIKSHASEAIIWDISDPFNAKLIDYKKSGDNLIFKSATDSLKTFFVFNALKAQLPFIKPVPLENQDLHASQHADMIIVTHPLFVSYAEKLANIHLENSGLTSLVVTIDQIYNEFSGGIPDIAGIRNFVRMKYMNQSASGHPLKYLLLFGDGSYENKTLPPKNPNFIPTYQSQNSNVVVSSFTSDDFYGLLEDGEGEADGSEDIGIGRLPVSDTVQAGIVISKIVDYLNPANMGDWRNIISMVADDEDGNTHMSDAEKLSKMLEDSVPSFNLEKIYLDAYKQTTDVSGQSYPDVNKAINDRINSGCLIFNYTGHGNERGLAHEQVLKIEDIKSWKNKNKLPLFITATCEFSRFDDVDINVVTKEMIPKSSAGEMALINKEGGAISLMSTTRLVYSAPNYFLNRNIFNYAFDRDEFGDPLRLGDIIRLAKNNSGTGMNKRNFSLLGDPALRLLYPYHGKIITDSINSISVTEKTDSIKALAFITIAGHIEDYKGHLMDDFNGTVYPLLYDKAIKIKTLANDGGGTMEFNLRNNVLFSGKTIARDGQFRFSFIVPRDIDYSYGNGKISYYASDQVKDIQGYFSDIIVGGFTNTVITDNTGPEIQLYMNDTLFRNGGITDSNPRLLAIIEDKGGINTTGSGIGHDLTGFLDDDPNSSIVLNNYFENDIDNYTRGKIIYDLSGLTKGNHKLTLKAWDNYNNSSVNSVLFVVETEGKFIIENLMNYPNPFINETTISADHNRPDNDLEIIIRIFSLNGGLIKTLRSYANSGGYAIPPIEWDGLTDGGERVSGGIYPYTMSLTTETGETAIASGRMIIL